MEMTQRNYGVWKNIIYVCLWGVNPCRLIKFRTSFERLLKFRSNQNSLHTLYRTLWNKLSLKDEQRRKESYVLEIDLRLIISNLVTCRYPLKMYSSLRKLKCDQF